MERITEVIQRAERMGILFDTRLNHVLDISEAHKQFNIDFNRWLEADDFNFAHDFIGISTNINRQTKSFNCFVPRFANAQQ